MRHPGFSHLLHFERGSKKQREKKKCSKARPKRKQKQRKFRRSEVSNAYVEMLRISLSTQIQRHKIDIPTRPMWMDIHSSPLPPLTPVLHHLFFFFCYSIAFKTKDKEEKNHPAFFLSLSLSIYIYICFASRTIMRNKCWERKTHEIKKKMKKKTVEK